MSTPESDDRDIDAWLQTLESPVPSAHLQRTVAEIPLRHPRATETWWPLGSLWRTFAAGVLVCTFGALAGSVDLDATSSQTSGANVAYDASSIDLAFGWSTEDEVSP